MTQEFWYYSAEIAPGVIKRGQYEDTLPMLPRMMLRHADVNGAHCLDVGTMEGLVPIVLTKRGAACVATDYSTHCEAKRDALGAAHGVEYDFREMPLAYHANKYFQSSSFDLINLSGLLYHVVSPLMVLMGIRPLLKRNGLLIVSTNVIAAPGMFAEFNALGRMQGEANTFWYPTIALLAYWLQLLRLAPVDAAFMPHAAVGKVTLGGDAHRYVFDKPSGYLSVVCRAVDSVPEDGWSAACRTHSVELQRLVDWPRVAAQPVSAITYAQERAEPWAEMATVLKARDHHDSHLLMLEDTF